jgi:hypothetical protein
MRKLSFVMSALVTAIVFPNLAHSLVVTQNLAITITAPNGSTLPSGVTAAAPDGETLYNCSGTPLPVTCTNTLNYFASHFSNSVSAWMDGKMLLGAWLEQPTDATHVGYDIAMGNNIYWNLAGHPSIDRADYNIIRNGGMHAVAPEHTANTGSETVAWAGYDEADLVFGPGGQFWGGVDGQSHCHANSNCTGATGGQCGWNVMKFFYLNTPIPCEAGDPYASGTPYPIDGHAVVQGLGKGVLEFESQSEAFGFFPYTDILSADVYFFTDNNAASDVTAACQVFWNNLSAPACNNFSGPGLGTSAARLAANYQANVTQLRRYNTGMSKPIIVDPEVGCPFGEGNCVIGAQFNASAWHGIIAGARGILWFQHSFSGPCVDFNTLYDGSNSGSSMYNCTITGNTGTSGSNTLHQVTQQVTATNALITQMAPQLLSPTVGGSAPSVGGGGYVTNVTGTVSYITKWVAAENAFYIFAASGKPGTVPTKTQNVTFNLNGSSGKTIPVVNESRNVVMSGFTFTDTFVDANTVHIYGPIHYP